MINVLFFCAFIMAMHFFLGGRGEGVNGKMHQGEGASSDGEKVENP